MSVLKWRKTDLLASTLGKLEQMLIVRKHMVQCGILLFITANLSLMSS